MAKYIALDFETSGLDASVHQPLEGYFVALDDSLKIVDELHVFIKTDPRYAIEKGAIEVNKINLEEHNSRSDSLSIDDAAEVIKKFILNNTKGRIKPKLLGHNIEFDKKFLFKMLGEDFAKKHLHYSSVCSKIVADFLKDCELLPPEIGTLESLSNFFSIKATSFHNAKDDTLTLVNVYGKLIEHMKTLKHNKAFTVDVLSLIER